MKKIILSVSLIWSVFVLMIGYPSVKLPEGELWITGLCGLILIALLPWIYPILKLRKKD